VTSLKKKKRPTRKQVYPPNVVPGGRDVTKEGEEAHKEAPHALILYLVDVTSLRKEKRPTRKQVNPRNFVPCERDVTKEGEEN
jgi:hypothetical protein